MRAFVSLDDLSANHCDVGSTLALGNAVRVIEQAVHVPGFAAAALPGFGTLVAEGCTASADHVITPMCDLDIAAAIWTTGYAFLSSHFLKHAVILGDDIGTWQLSMESTLAFCTSFTRAGLAQATSIFDGCWWNEASAGRVVTVCAVDGSPFDRLRSEASSNASHEERSDLGKRDVLATALGRPCAFVSGSFLKLRSHAIATPCMLACQSHCAGGRTELSTHDTLNTLVSLINL